MKQALAITGVAAAATLTLGGLLVAVPESAMAAKHHRHGHPAAARSHRHVQLHHRHVQARRMHHVVNITSSGAVFAPGYGRAPGGLTIRF